MTKRKISVFIDAGVIAKKHQSGIGHLLLNLLKEMSQHDKLTAEYKLILFGTINEVRYLRSFGSFNVTVKVLPLFSRRLINALNYWRILLPIDLFLGKGIYIFPNYINYPVSKRSKSLTWVHDLAFEKLPETVSPKLQRNLSQNIRRWMNRSTRVITLSNFIKHQITDTFQIPLEKIDVVYCGVDVKHFYKRDTSEVKFAQVKYGIPPNYILFVGNIEPRKNLGRLVEAYTKLKPSITSKYSLIIIGGDGWNSEGIFQAIHNAQRNGYNIILPHKYVEDSDMPAIMSGAECVITPSLYEGFGMTPLEALACGTRPIVSRMPVFKEIYKSAVKSFNPEDVKSMITTIEDALSKRFRPSQQLVEAYSWRKASEQTLKIISKI
jgi:glycosyltransferase involved in cell wall biosynthesis